MEGKQAKGREGKGRVYLSPTVQNVTASMELLKRTVGSGKHITENGRKLTSKAGSVLLCSESF